jgi:putative hydrolase of the HAD superfamily
MVEAFLLVVESTGPTVGAHAVLDELAAAGIATGIITNGFSFLQKRKAQAHGLTERVRFVLTSEDAGAHKPDPRIFRRALDAIGVEAHDCWHVGDHRDNDIAAASWWPGAVVRTSIHRRPMQRLRCVTGPKTLAGSSPD